MSLYDLLMEMHDNDLDQAAETPAMLFAQKADHVDPYVVTSAFHKELRRHDFEKAAYWALILDRVRGRFFVLRYLSNVATEESHMPGFKADLAKAFMQYKGATLVDVLRAVETFCQGTHWKYMTEIEDIVWQINSYMWSDVGAHAKAKKRIYVPQPDLVEKWEKILPDSTQVLVKDLYTTPEILALLDEALQAGDLKKSLYVSTVCDCWPKLHKYTKELLISTPDTACLHAALDNAALKKASFWNFDYETLILHKLGVLPDMSDWRGDEPQRSTAALENLIAYIHQDVAEHGVKKAPLYALDSHTRAGKAVWLKQRHAIQANAPCKVADLRYAAEWVSLLWRYEAYKQYGHLNVAWEDVVLPEDRYYKTLWKGAYAYDKESSNPWWRADWPGYRKQAGPDA